MSANITDGEIKVELDKELQKYDQDLEEQIQIELVEAVAHLKSLFDRQAKKPSTMINQIGRITLDAYKNIIDYNGVRKKDGAAYSPTQKLKEHLEYYLNPDKQKKGNDGSLLDQKLIDQSIDRTFQKSARRAIDPKVPSYSKLPQLIREQLAVKKLQETLNEKGLEEFNEEFTKKAPLFLNGSKRSNQFCQIMNNLIKKSRQVLGYKENSNYRFIRHWKSTAEKFIENIENIEQKASKKPTSGKS